mmetsp:Transcript_10665/g.15400  ORF Transcript_10665/g.15400 Transcript_10665/m.15400 type:complete len:96 (+) Transcript_10665:247-534(+)
MKVILRNAFTLASILLVTSFTTINAGKLRFSKIITDRVLKGNKDNAVQSIAVPAATNATIQQTVSSLFATSIHTSAVKVKRRLFDFFLLIYDSSF